MLIDTSFDFRADASGKDPDAYGFTLCRYHKLLWNRVLPSGALFDLEVFRRAGVYALYHRSKLGEYFLTSDSITHTYTRWSALKRITGLFSEEENETFRTLGYTIGGMLVFPGNRIDGKQTINGARGCHWKIKDRFDLTLECILRHYIGQHSPLEDTLKRYGDFFALFEDFRGYVEFFMLQDLVVDDYSRVKFLMAFDDFRSSPVPGNVDAYREYRRLTIEFLEARNRRIDRYAASYRGTGAIGQIQPTKRASMSTQGTPNAAGGTSVVAAAAAPALRRARTEMTEAQALAEAEFQATTVVAALDNMTTSASGRPAFTGKGEQYGWLGGALYLQKTAAASGLLGASWKLGTDPTITIEATTEGYLVKDTKAGTESKAANLKIARAQAAAILADRPEAQEYNKKLGEAYIQVEAPRPEPPKRVEVKQAEPEIFIAPDAPRTRRPGMTEPQQEKPFEKPKSRTYERLKCTPIMLYPDSQDDREEIQAAARADNRSVSNYILTLVLKHLRGGNDAW
jgi:hypothetical protein